MRRIRHSQWGARPARDDGERSHHRRRLHQRGCDRPQLFPDQVELSRLRDGVILILTGVGSALVVAILLSLLLIASGRFDIDDLFPSIVRSFVGDTIGIAVVSPLMLRFWYLRRHLTPASIRSALPEAVVYVALISTTASTPRPSPNSRHSCWS